MKAYFEYIAENEKSFLRFRFQVILVIIFLSILIGALIFGQNGLEDYSKEKGIVSEIHPNTIKVESSGPIVTRGTVEKDVVDLIINQKRFIVRFQIDKNKNTVLRKIKKGDFVEVYYSSNDGYFELSEIKKNGDSILNYADRKKEMSLFHYLIPSLLLISVLLFILVVRLRRNYLLKN